MNVSGLLFDTDDVLYDDSWWRLWLHQLLTRMGLHSSYVEFFREWQHDYLDEVNRGRREFWDALADYLRKSGLTLGQVDEILAASHAKRRQLLDSVRPLPGVLTTTAKLSAMGLPMGILCNAPWSTERIRQLLDQLGLANRFSSINSSCEVGWTKPAKQSYWAALTAMRMDAKRVAFVGHDAVELSGARAAGMPTIAINYDVDTQADVYLQHFDQLLSQICYRPSHLLAG